MKFATANVKCAERRCSPQSGASAAPRGNAERRELRVRLPRHRAGRAAGRGSALQTATTGLCAESFCRNKGDAPKRRSRSQQRRTMRFLRRRRNLQTSPGLERAGKGGTPQHRARTAPGSLAERRPLRNRRRGTPRARAAPPTASTGRAVREGGGAGPRPSSPRPPAPAARRAGLGWAAPLAAALGPLERRERRRASPRLTSAAARPAPRRSLPPPARRRRRPRPAEDGRLAELRGQPDVRWLLPGGRHCGLLRRQIRLGGHGRRHLPEHHGERGAPRGVRRSRRGRGAAGPRGAAPLRAEWAAPPPFCLGLRRGDGRARRGGGGGGGGGAAGEGRAALAERGPARLGPALRRRLRARRRRRW